MLKKRHSLRVALSATFLALVMLVTAQAVSSPTAGASASAPSAGNIQAAATPSLSKAQKAKRLRANRRARQRAFFRKCYRKRSRKFNERQARFPRHVKLAGRCITARVPGIKIIGTRPGHLPSANRALDIMVNTRGSCTAGRKAGNRIAQYFMNFKSKHKVSYVIWKNGYWNARDRPRPISQYRKMGRGGCTQGHYDHVHVAFR